MGTPSCTSRPRMPWSHEAGGAAMALEILIHSLLLVGCLIRRSGLTISSC
jgi:hypothetical protein